MKISSVFDDYMTQKDRIKNKIDYKISKSKKNKMFIFIPAFSLITLFVFAILTYYRPVSYVSMDINPSILLTTNSYEKVIKIEPLNAEAKELVKDINLINKDISVAMKEILDQAVKFNYVEVADEQNAILTTVYCDNEQQRVKLSQKIHDGLSNDLNGKGIKAQLIDQNMSEVNIKNSNHYGVSEGKVNFVNEVIKDHPELTFEELINLPVREIVKLVGDPNYYNQGSENRNGQNKK